MSHLHVPPRVSIERFSALAGRAALRHFSAGTHLMRQGDVSDFMFVIASGRVRVERTHPVLTAPLTIAELGVGGVVGEIGLRDGEHLSATVTAIEDTETVALSTSSGFDPLGDYAEITRALFGGLLDLDVVHENKTGRAKVRPS